MSEKTTSIPGADEADDPFGVLGFNRSPWLDPSLLRQRFRAEAARAHPDSQEGDAGCFKQLNEVFAALENPVTRLRTMVRLEFGEKQTAPSRELPDGFVEISEAMMTADALLREQRAAATALGRVAAAGRLAEAAGRLREIADGLEARLEVLDGLCREAGDGWREQGGAYWLGIAAQYAFLRKWRREVLEKYFQLTNPESLSFCV